VPRIRLAPVEHIITEAIRSFIERLAWGWIREGDTVVVIGKKELIDKLEEIYFF